jgi:hypothetical protein
VRNTWEVPTEGTLPFLEKKGWGAKRMGKWTRRPERVVCGADGDVLKVGLVEYVDWLNPVG